jgi:hypothetical protein
MSKARDRVMSPSGADKLMLRRFTLISGRLSPTCNRF